MFGNEISFSQGLLITALGMGVTFVALIALSFVLDLLRVLFYKDPNKTKPVEVQEKPNDKTEEIESNEEDIDNEKEDEELIAIITAAIAANLNTSTHNIVVRNIVRVPDTTPVWGKAGRMEQMNRML